MIISCGRQHRGMLRRGTVMHGLWRDLAGTSGEADERDEILSVSRGCTDSHLGIATEEGNPAVTRRTPQFK